MRKIHFPFGAEGRDNRTAKKTDQIILVIGHQLSLWNKQEDGTWKRAWKTYCGYGKKGLVKAKKRREGSMTTPLGAFPILFGFGKAKNPGTAMEYRRITPNSYYSGARDRTYNTWVESRTPVAGEHLIDYYQYQYAMSIGFNVRPTRIGRGSAIFLHCKSKGHWYTAGCVSVKKRYMLRLLRQAADHPYIIITKKAKNLKYY